jgi:rhodanese-related sulfurtransferase
MKVLLAVLGWVGLAFAAVAGPAVVGHDACPTYAVDIEAFATCEGDRVTMPDDIRLADGMLIAEVDVPYHKRTAASLYVDAQRAYALKRDYPDAVVLIDIRSGVELGLSGHAQGVDLNVPFRDFVQPLAWDEPSSGWKMTANPRFAAELDQRLRQYGASYDTVVMLICRSGDRSALAADVLTQAGYRRVLSVIDGYEGDVGSDGRSALNGWKNAGLPWTARVDAALIAGVH